MPDYHRLYLKLTGALADAIDSLNEVTECLVRAQQEAEDIILDSPEPQIIPLDTGKVDDE